MNTYSNQVTAFPRDFSQPFFLEPARSILQPRVLRQSESQGWTPTHRPSGLLSAQADADAVLGRKRSPLEENIPTVVPTTFGAFPGTFMARTPAAPAGNPRGHNCVECQAREAWVNACSPTSALSTNWSEPRASHPGQPQVSDFVREEKFEEMEPTPGDSLGEDSVPNSFDFSHKLDRLLADKEESDKAILKVILFEVIINEKVNKHRLSFLPNQVVEVLALFLKRHYGFCLESALKEGSPQKYLFPIRVSGGETDTEDALIIESFRFRFQLYFQGVKKKLPKNNTKLTEDYYVTKSLFEKVFSNHNLGQDSRSNKLTLFWSLVQMTFNKESPLTVETIKACLPRPVLMKLQGLGEHVLKKYYVIKLKQYLDELFAGHKTSVAQIKQRLHVSERFRLFSDLMQDPEIKAATERRNYHIGPSLDLD